MIERVQPFYTFYYYYKQKKGNSRREYEDSFNFDFKKSLFCVSDGASESIYSKLWSTLLSSNFINNEDIFTDLVQTEQKIPVFILKSIESWWNIVRDEKNPWNVKEKIRQGSYATFLGLFIDVNQEFPLNWNCIAIGDSCLFHIRNDNLLNSFPLKNSDEFNNIPNLISSISSYYNDDLFLCSSGFIEKGDILLLASDAFSKWLLENRENVKARINCFINSSWDSLTLFIDKQIEEKKFSNDDVTILIIKF